MRFKFSDFYRATQCFSRRSNPTQTLGLKHTFFDQATPQRTPIGNLTLGAAKMRCKDIFTKLKLTAVERPSEVKLPDLEFVSEVLGNELKILGMSRPKFKVTQDFKYRIRDPAGDPVIPLKTYGRGKGMSLDFIVTNPASPKLQFTWIAACVLRRI
jgi:hypothetical protein